MLCVQQRPLGHFIRQYQKPVHDALQPTCPGDGAVRRRASRSIRSAPAASAIPERLVQLVGTSFTLRRRVEVERRYDTSARTSPARCRSRLPRRAPTVRRRTSAVRSRLVVSTSRSGTFRVSAVDVDRASTSFPGRARCGFLPSRPFDRFDARARRDAVSELLEPVRPMRLGRYCRTSTPTLGSLQVLLRDGVSDR
jgi:hypothetical protein